MSVGQSATNGWDAVCAISASGLSRLLREQYLQDGPTSPVDPVRLVTADGGDLLILDVVLGPPDLSFPAGDLAPDECRIDMALVRGALLQWSPDDGVLRSVLPVDPDSSSIGGPVRLTQVRGEVNAIGRVQLDLAAGAYAPRISGIDPQSTAVQALGLALSGYFAGRASTYLLHTMAKSDVPACLQPTSFKLATQPADDDGGGDGCVAILISTDGLPGTDGPLPKYPIPGGDTAALLVSGRILFDGLIVPMLNQEMQRIGCTYKASAVDGVYQATGSGGQCDLGRIPPTYPGRDAPYSSDENGYAADVIMPTASSSIAPSSGGLLFTWTSTFDQWWTVELEGSGFYGPESDKEHAAMKADFELPYGANADPLTDIVSFSGQGTAKVTPQDPDEPEWKWLLKYLIGEASAPDQLQTATAGQLQSILGKLQLPHVETFALQNLLFPSDQALRLGSASVPGDLLLSGGIEPSLVVTPSLATVAPGQSQQFTATLDGQPVSAIWEATPELGQLDSTGLYKAPTDGAPDVVVITAIDKDNAATVGRALVQLSPQAADSALAVVPGSVILTADQRYDLVVTDASGNPVDATLTTSPDIGTLTKGLTTGAWTYRAPATITQPERVTVTASASGDLSGTATIRLAVATEIKVTASAQSVEAGKTVQLTASTGGLDVVWWAVYATGDPGTITGADAGAHAGYTAPASVQSSQEITVVAYGYDDRLAGVGHCPLTLVPTTQKADGAPA
jgi:hypothetical protein